VTPAPQGSFRVMTHNIGGGAKQFKGTVGCITEEQRQAVMNLITKMKADILCVQEVVQHTDADGILHSMVEHIRQAGDYENFSYGETLSMKKHMQVKKGTMVDGLFKDWWDWSTGNAMFSHWPFSRLGDVNKGGVPRNIPIFQPVLYEGNRDSDPRFVILGRIKRAPYPYVLNLHLTTLVGERPPTSKSDIIDAARLVRYHQLERVLDLVKRHIIDAGHPLLLMGDFNATPGEYCIEQFLEQELGFVRLIPKNKLPTHAKAGMVDHIFFSPAERLVGYECWIENRKLARQVSDHLPVLADIIIK